MDGCFKAQKYNFDMELHLNIANIKCIEKDN